VNNLAVEYAERSAQEGSHAYQDHAQMLDLSAIRSVAMQGVVLGAVQSAVVQNVAHGVVRRGVRRVGQGEGVDPHVG